MRPKATIPFLTRSVLATLLVSAGLTVAFLRLPWADQGPVITAITPTAAYVGKSVTITDREDDDRSQRDRGKGDKDKDDRCDHPLDPRGEARGINKRCPAPAITSLGPNRIAGRVRAIVVRSDDPNTIWVASATGGLWVSRDAGENWSRADDFLPTLTFSSLEADPSNPDVMYAGSGEIFTFIREGTWLRAEDRGAGIFKTTNGGATWSQLAKTNTADFFYVSRIAVHPTKPNIVLAGTRTGLFRSQNAGAEWRRVLPAAPADPDITFLDVKFHPSDPANAVATAHELGIFYSVDDTLSWQDASPLPAGLAEGTGTQTRIELAPSLSQPGTWFALHIDDGGGPVPLVLIRSSNRGQTWTAVTGSPIICDGDQLANNNRYTGVLWVNPLNPKRILAGGGKLCLSTDGGITFTSYPDPGRTLHFDHHALATLSVTSNPDLAVLYNGNDGGVNRLRWDATPTNRRLNNLLGNQQFHSATMNPISEVLIGGAQDIGTLRRSADGVWTELIGNPPNGSDGIFVATDPTDPDFWYFGQTVGQIRRSRDGGVDPENVEKIAPGDRLEPACFNLTPLLLDPTDPNVLYAGCHQLWRTRNAKAPDPSAVASSWSPILTVSSDADANHLITTMAVAASDPSVMWVGTMRGTGGNPLAGREVWRTTKLQAASPTFSPIDVAALPNRGISRIAVHPSDSALAYVSLTGWAHDGNLWKRTRIQDSFGWEDISAGLPPGPIHSVSVHPTVPNWIYAGTDAGLYVSHDDGATWSATTRGPARVPISDLTWVDDHRLIIATYGRGVFVLDERPNPERVIVEQVSYLAGNQLSGHLENLLESDNYRMVSGPNVTTGTISMELTGRTGLSWTGVTFVGFTIESSTTDLSFLTTPQQAIELFNFVTGRYVTVFSGAVGTTDQSTQGGVVVRAAELISATGELRARVTWSGALLRSSAIDLAHWTIDRP